MNGTLIDAVAYIAHDAIKEKGMPGKEEFIEDIVTPAAYHYFISDLINQFGLDRIFGAMDSLYKEEIKKFIAEALTIYGIRMFMKGSLSIQGIILKQLLSQAMVMVYKKTMGSTGIVA